MTWLYDDERWPNFYWNSSMVIPKLTKVKEKIRDWEQGRIVFRDLRIIGNYDFNNYVNHLCVSGISSSKIENVDIDQRAFYRSIKKQIKEIVTARNRNVMIDEDGLAMMILDANIHYSKPLDKGRLWNWHKWLFPKCIDGDGEELETGQWRTTFMSVANYEAPPPDGNRVDKEMEQFLAWFESDEDADEPILKAAKSHLWFEKIHPFGDGNGRIGRAIIELLLGRAGNDEIIDVYHAMTREISLNLRGDRNKPGYYDLLGRHDVVSSHRDVFDITDWIIWFLDQLSNSMNYVQEVDESRDERCKVFMYACKQSLNERQKKALLCMLDLDWESEEVWTGNLTKGRYIEITGAKGPTASKDIEKLVKQGILETRKATATKNWSYSLKSWGDIVKEDEIKHKSSTYETLRRLRKNSTVVNE